MVFEFINFLNTEYHPQIGEIMMKHFDVWQTYNETREENQVGIYLGDNLILTPVNGE